MTLIVAFAAPPYAVMVADRRLTWPDGSLADDCANKIVMFCNQMAFAYTGRALIEGENIDEWLAAELLRLPSRSIESACIHIRDRATDLFSRPPLRGKFHAFIGIGFMPTTKASGTNHLIVKISNMYDGEYLLDEPRPEFKWT